MTTTQTTLRIDATFLGLRDIGPWLNDLFKQEPSSPAADVVGSIELAVHELAANAVDHACPADGIVSLDAVVTNGELVIRMTDTGIAFEGATRPDADTPQVRGYGLMIIEQVSTDLHYERTTEQNVWTARFALGSDEHTNPTNTDSEQEA